MKKFLILIAIVVSLMLTYEVKATAYYITDGSIIDGKTVKLASGGVTNVIDDTYLKSAVTNEIDDTYLKKNGDTAGDLTVTNLYVGKAELHTDESKDQLTVSGVGRMYVRDVICSNLIVESTDTWTVATQVIFSNSVHFIDTVGSLNTGGGDVTTEGGRLITGGGTVLTHGGTVSTGGGNLRTGGGYVQTQGGYVNTQGGYVNMGQSYITNVVKLYTTNTTFEIHCGDNVYIIGE